MACRLSTLFTVNLTVACLQEARNRNCCSPGCFYQCTHFGTAPVQDPFDLLRVALLPGKSNGYKIHACVSDNQFSYWLFVDIYIESKSASCRSAGSGLSLRYRRVRDKTERAVSAHRW
jgi:hypothetical protein